MTSTRVTARNVAQRASRGVEKSRDRSIAKSRARSMSMLRDGSNVEATWSDGTTAGAWCGTQTQPDERCDHVHRRLKRIVKARGSLDAQEAAALREAQHLRLWRHYGYSSLVEYMEREMGYTPRAAIERLRVAKAIEELPAIAEALTNGELSFSRARELTRVARPETEQQWVEAAAEMNVRQIEDIVSGHEQGDLPTEPPKPELKTKVLRYEVKVETAALEREVKRALEKELGERLDEDGFMRTMFRRILDATRARSRDGVAAREPTTRGESTAVIAPLSTDPVVVEQQPSAERAVEQPCTERIEYNGRAPYQIAVTICERCRRGWQDSGGTSAPMSLPMLERALCDAQHIGSILGGNIVRASQTIPPATRRMVMRRDRNRCRVPGCRSIHNLDVHHIRFLCDGGGHEMSN